MSKLQKLDLIRFHDADSNVCFSTNSLGVFCQICFAQKSGWWQRWEAGCHQDIQDLKRRYSTPEKTVSSASLPTSAVWCLTQRGCHSFPRLAFSKCHRKTLTPFVYQLLMQTVLTIRSPVVRLTGLQDTDYLYQNYPPLFQATCVEKRVSCFKDRLCRGPSLEEADVDWPLGIFEVSEPWNF